MTMWLLHGQDLKCITLIGLEVEPDESRPPLGEGTRPEAGLRPALLLGAVQGVGQPRLAH